MVIQNPDGKPLRTLAAMSLPFDEVYGLLPGSYRVDFHSRYAMPLDFAVEAGVARDINLDTIYGYLAFPLPAGVAEYNIRGEDGAKLATVAWYALRPADRIGLKPGRYNLVSDRFSVPLPVAIAAGQDTPVRVGEQAVRMLLEFPESTERPDLVVLDPSGKTVGTTSTYSMQPDTPLYLPPGQWRLSLSSYEPIDVEAVAGKELRVQLRSTAPSEPPAGGGGGAGKYR